MRHHRCLSIIAIAVISLTDRTLRANELNGLDSRSPSTGRGCDFNEVCAVDRSTAFYRIYGYSGATSPLSGRRILVRAQIGIGTSAVCSGSWSPPTMSGTELGFNGRPSSTGFIPWVAAPVWNNTLSREEIWVGRSFSDDTLSGEACLMDSGGWRALPTSPSGHEILTAPGAASTSGSCPTVWVFVVDNNGGLQNHVMSSAILLCDNPNFTWRAWDLAVPPLAGNGSERFVSSPAVALFDNTLQVWAFTRDNSGTGTFRLRHTVYDFALGTWVTSGGNWLNQLTLPTGVTPAGAPAITGGPYGSQNYFWVAFQDTSGNIRVQRWAGNWNPDWTLSPLPISSAFATPTFAWREGWGQYSHHGSPGTDWLSMVYLNSSGNLLSESRKLRFAEQSFDMGPLFMRWTNWLGMIGPF